MTIVKTISLCSATSRGLSAQRAPASSSGSAFSRVRFQTVTVCPASSRRRDDRAAHHAEPDVAELSHRCTPFVAGDRRSSALWTSDSTRTRWARIASRARPRRAPRSRRGSRGAARATRSGLLGNEEDRHQRAPDRRRAAHASCGGRAGSASPRRSRDGSGGRRRCSGRRGRLVAASAAAISVDRGVHLARGAASVVPLGGERRRLALEDPAQLVEVVHRRLSSRVSRSCSELLSGFAASGDDERAAVAAVSITPCDSSIRSASRTEERPDAEALGQLALGRQRVARLQPARADLAEQLLGDQLVHLAALDRLVAHGSPPCLAACLTSRRRGTVRGRVPRAQAT